MGARGRGRCRYCHWLGGEEPEYMEPVDEQESNLETYMQVQLPEDAGPKPFLMVESYIGGCALERYFSIRYCPICGRDLEEDDG